MPSDFEFDSEARLSSDYRSAYGDAEPSTFIDYLTFRRMLVPILIQVIFWIGFVAIIWYAIDQIKYVKDTRMIVVGALLTLGALLVWRVLCELNIIFFRMNETLTDIRIELRKQNRRK